MNINKIIKNLKIYDSTLIRFKEVEKNYKYYLRLLDTLSKENLALFLEVIKQEEITYNQKMEGESNLLIEMDKLAYETNSISYLAKIINDKEPFNLNNVKKLHHLVIRGTIDDKIKNYDYRKRNIKVGRIVDGKEVISYIPPEHKDVIPLVVKVLNFLNEDDSKLFDNIFLKPLIAHVLLAIIQPFGNGNTRLARLIQYGKILDLTNQKYKTNFKLPTFYLSDNYMKNKGYRNKIRTLANSMHNDDWDDWFKYNIILIEEQLFYLSSQIPKIKNKRI